MTQHQSPRQPGEPPAGPTLDSPGERTGHETVDAVLDSLEGLDQQPPAEHVAVFESAHDRLRAALSEAGSD